MSIEQYDCIVHMCKLCREANVQIRHIDTHCVHICHLISDNFVYCSSGVFHSFLEVGKKMKQGILVVRPQQLFLERQAIRIVHSYT